MAAGSMGWCRKDRLCMYSVQVIEQSFQSLNSNNFLKLALIFSIEGKILERKLKTFFLKITYVIDCNSLSWVVWSGKWKIKYIFQRSNKCTYRVEWGLEAIWWIFGVDRLDGISTMLW